MKIFSILDQSEAASKDNAFIFYDKAANRGYIEISRKCDENALPAALMLLKRKGILTINNEVTQKFIESRVVPRDRQNMPEIMAELHMKEYDPWFLFEYLHGRCSQDDCFVKNINEDSLPDEIKKRLEKHISKAYALDDFRLFLIFQNGKTGIIDIEKIRSSNRHFRRICSEKNFFDGFLIEKNGFSIYWNCDTEILYDELYDSSKKSNLTHSDISELFRANLCDTAEACEKMHVSRQWLAKQEKLDIIKKTPHSVIYDMSDVRKGMS